MYGHTAVIYRGRTIKSARGMFEGKFGRRVKEALPFRFSAGENSYVVLIAKHLINVERLQETHGTSS